MKYSSMFFDGVAKFIWTLCFFGGIILALYLKSFYVLSYIWVGGFVTGSVFAYFSTSTAYYEKILKNTPRIKKGETHIDKKDFSKK